MRASEQPACGATSCRGGPQGRAVPDGLPAIVRVWRAHWAEFIPFLAFPPEVRRVIYTTNLIEPMNSRLPKVTRNRGQSSASGPHR
jgi:transposase-like protein